MPLIMPYILCILYEQVAQKWMQENVSNTLYAVRRMLTSDDNNTDVDAYV